jgi:hypothetical protein
VTLDELTAKRESMRKSLGHRRSRGVSRGFDALRCLIQTCRRRSASLRA